MKKNNYIHLFVCVVWLLFFVAPVMAQPILKGATMDGPNMQHRFQRIIMNVNRSGYNGYYYTLCRHSETEAYSVQDWYNSSSDQEVIYVKGDKAGPTWVAVATDPFANNVLCEFYYDAAEWRPIDLSWRVLKLYESHPSDSIPVVWGFRCSVIIEVTNHDTVPFYDYIYAYLYKDGETSPVTNIDMCGNEGEDFERLPLQPGATKKAGGAVQGNNGWFPGISEKPGNTYYLDPGAKYHLRMGNQRNGLFTLDLKKDIAMFDGVFTFFSATEVPFYRSDGSTGYMIPEKHDDDTLVFRVPYEACHVDFFCHKHKGWDKSKIIVDLSSCSPNSVYNIFPACDVVIPRKDNVVEFYPPIGCSQFTLHSGHDFFYSSIFSSNRCKYVEDLDGRSRLMTLCLPFDALELVAYDEYGRVIDEPVVAKEYKGHLMVGEPSRLFFTEVSSIAADKPYLVYLPEGARRLEAHSYTAKDKQYQICYIWNESFKDKAVWSAPDEYEKSAFTGVYRKKQVENVYVLNEEGTAFVHRSTLDADPFHPWIEHEGDFDVLVIHDIETSIHDMSAVGSPAMADVYTLDGRKVCSMRMVDGRDELSGLPRGIYVVKSGGKARKVAVR